MADFALQIQATGLQELVRRNLANESFPIDRIKFGSGQYTPSGIETDIMTPFSPVKEFVNPAGSVSGTNLQIVFNDPSTDIYNIGEIGIFSGTFMFALISRPASEGWILQKSNNPLVVPVSYQFNATLPSVVSFNVANTHPLGTELITGMVRAADQDEAEGLVENTKFMTSLRSWQQTLHQKATQDEYNAGTVENKWVSADLNVPATRISGTLGLPNFPKVTQSEWNDLTDTDNENKLVPADLLVPAARLTGNLPLDSLPNSVSGNRSFRVSSSNVGISASKTNPSIVNISDITSDGKVVLGAGSNVPALALSVIPAAGGDSHYVYVSGTFTGLRLHAAGAADTFSSGDKIYLASDFSGFTKTNASNARQIGVVLDGNTATGIYDVVIDLWSPFLGDSAGGISLTNLDILNTPFILLNGTRYTWLGSGVAAAWVDLAGVSSLNDWNFPATTREGVIIGRAVVDNPTQNTVFHVDEFRLTIDNVVQDSATIVVTQHTENLLFDTTLGGQFRDGIVHTAEFFHRIPSSTQPRRIEFQGLRPMTTGPARSNFIHYNVRNGGVFGMVLGT